ncbi:cyclase [Candidatus Woesearchaeota archaeon CG10_big_fil_rev_8_21_14_0_10_37_12]|nr:MAG: cyclase [Candidatus Woesearchaeota archaeon CG10_big_fil_rev_8_21_14_0_10_37_12]
MKIIDISMTLHNKMIVYPGNKAFKQKPIKAKKDATSFSSELHMGSHTGTHIDAPKHVRKRGQGVDKVALDYCVGPCQVIDATEVPFGKGVCASCLSKKKITEKIVLLKTKNSTRKSKTFNKKFVYLTEDGAAYLQKKGVKTVGIDYLSIQKFHQGYCAAHCELLNKNCIIFEGLDLLNTKSGKYTFVGLPLKIKKGDGAPARVILIKNE